MADQAGGETQSDDEGRWPLPEGWCWATLGELLPLSYGKALKKSDREDGGEVIVYGSSGAVGSHTKALAPAGSLVVGRKGSAGSVHLAKNPCWPIDTAYFTTPNDELDATYWFYQLSALRLAQHDQSTAIPSLNRDTYSPISVPIPPAAEQARIADKIDALFAQVEAGETALAEARRNVARYRKSVLKAAVTGELTADWRAEQDAALEDGEALRTRLLTERRAAWESDQIAKAETKGKPLKGEAWKAKYKQPVEPETEGLPDLPKGWVWASVDQLVSTEERSMQSGPFGSNLLHSEFTKTGRLVVGIDNVGHGEFRPGSDNRIPQSKFEALQKFQARPFDVLITVMATIGRTCVVPPDIEPAIITKHLYRLTIARSIADPYFTELNLRGSPSARSQMRKDARGQTRPGLNKAIVQRLPIALCSLPEQTEIVARVEAALADADRLDAQLDAQERAAKALRQSILKAAFEGRLVNQDPNDEPASVLLARIKAERASRPKAKRGKSNRKSAGAKNG